MEKINELQNWKEHLKSLEDEGILKEWLSENPLRIPFHLWSQLLKWNLKKYFDEELLVKMVEYPPLLKTLLFHGIDPSLLDGVTLEPYLLKMVKFFKQLHLHLHDIDENDKTLVVRLAERGTERDCLFLRSLIERMDIDDDLLINADDDGFVPLHHAVLQENVNMVREFVRYSVDLNTPDSNGNTSLHHACLLGNREIVDLLVDAKADMFIKDNEGNTPADVAIDNCKDAVSSDPYDKWYGKKSGMSREERKLMMYEKRFAAMNGPKEEGDDTDDMEVDQKPKEPEKQPRGGYRKKRGGRRISASSIDIKHNRKNSKVIADPPLSAPVNKQEWAAEEAQVISDLKRKRSKDLEDKAPLKRIKLADPVNKITQVFTSSDLDKQIELEVDHIGTQTMSFGKNCLTQTTTDVQHAFSQCQFGGKIPESSIYPIFTFPLLLSNKMMLLAKQAKSVFEIFGIKQTDVPFTRLAEGDLILLQKHPQLQLFNDLFCLSVVEFKEIIKENKIQNQLLFIECHLDVPLMQDTDIDNVVVIKEKSPFELLKNAREITKIGKESIKQLLGIQQHEDKHIYEQIIKLPPSVAFKLLYTRNKYNMK